MEPFFRRRPLALSAVQPDDLGHAHDEDTVEPPEDAMPDDDRGSSLGPRVGRLEQLAYGVGIQAASAERHLHKLRNDVTALMLSREEERARAEALEVIVRQLREDLLFRLATQDREVGLRIDRHKERLDDHDREIAAGVRERESDRLLARKIALRVAFYGGLVLAVAWFMVHALGLAEFVGGLRP